MVLLQVSIKILLLYRIMTAWIGAQMQPRKASAKGLQARLKTAQ